MSSDQKVSRHHNEPDNSTDLLLDELEQDLPEPQKNDLYSLHYEYLFLILLFVIFVVILFIFMFL